VKSVAASALVLLLAMPAWAAEKAQIFVTAEQGFARIILSFPGRFDMPRHDVKVENGVLAITFDEPIDIALPDVSKIVPDYLSVGRVDPDGKGVRFALRTKLNFNPMDAGEKLFLDLLPPNWQGMPPALPPEVVADLAKRAEEAATLAEQRRLAEQAQILKPTATLRIGRNPTFTRLQFDWNAETKASFTVDMANIATLHFNWPVPIELWRLKADLPPEIKVVDNVYGPAGSDIKFRVADGVTPRFYATSETQFIVDIDTGETQLQKPIDAAALLEAAKAAPAGATGEGGDGLAQLEAAPAAVITPFFSAVGSTVRVVFPFDRDTPAAVFRRGDTLWMVFDTMTGVNPPPADRGFDVVAKSFTVAPSGGTQIVKIELNGDRLATLGSQGMAWVLSLGDVLLTPTEPVALNRRLDTEGFYELTADLERPGSVHEFVDPIVGDKLTVVTAYPPARGITRDQAFVDFTAMRSVHGLVVRPNREGVDVDLDSRLAVIHSPAGLTVSSLESRRAIDLGAGDKRDNFVDFNALVENNPSRFVEHRDALMVSSSAKTGKARDLARLDLAQLLIANRFGIEALGVLKVMDEGLSTPNLKKNLQLAAAIANTEAARPADALAILNAEGMNDDPDAQVWRTIARADAGDFRGARADAMSAETAIESYPIWVRTRFQLAAIRSAIETNDPSLATHYLQMLDVSHLEPEEVSTMRLLSGRIDEAMSRDDQALDAYGQVIAADYRPSRAEAIYRTLVVLRKQGRLDEAKATQTLAAESMLWRGGLLEAQMQGLLAELYFEQGQYRLGLETVKQAAAFHKDAAPVSEMSQLAATQFAELYLNGRADALEPVEALALFYDYRELTPPGARGDEMIRNLARRLVKVDLLAQAADLLQYQIDSRLKGVAQAQVGADLAVIQIANRNPEAALRVLSKTRLEGLAPTLERQRRILEARAMIDAGRNDLALDMLSRMKGRDIDLLRVDAQWNAKRYSKAGELMEALYGVPANGEPMNGTARMGIIKAAVGYVLSNDTLGLSRIRTKFGDQMANSPQWAMFDFVTSQISAPSPAEFKQVARAVAGMDSLNAFLSSYQENYGKGGALAPAKPDAA